MTVPCSAGDWMAGGGEVRINAPIYLVLDATLRVKCGRKQDGANTAGLGASTWARPTDLPASAPWPFDTDACGNSTAAGAETNALCGPVNSEEVMHFSARANATLEVRRCRLTPPSG